jgi:universal stress protein A
MQPLENSSRLQLNNVLLIAQFPPWADVAVPYALALAREHRARMQVTHAIPTHASQRVTNVPQGGAFRQPWRKVVFEAGARLAAIDDGTRAARLGDITGQHNFDLAIVSYGGTFRRSEGVVEKALEHVLVATDCPVMVIGPAVDTERVPRSEPATVVHATDFSPQALAAAQHAFSWSQEYQSWITLLHVVEGIGAWTEHERERLKEPFRYWLQELVPAELPIWCEVEYQVEFGRPADKIVATAERLHADLIVIGLTGMDALAQNRPGETALQVIANAPCPVLVVRDYMKTTATQPVADDHQRGAAGMAA